MLNTRKIFLEQCNDGLVSIFEDKINEFQADIKSLNRKELKNDMNNWELFIYPLIEHCQKKIKKFKWLIGSIITYNKVKFEERQVDLDDLRERLDIVEIIRGYVDIKNAGRGEYKALCPFHNEKTPSLFINRDKKVWHCFGCGEGGNVITFLMKIEGWDFKKTINYLKQQYG